MNLCRIAMEGFKIKMESLKTDEKHPKRAQVELMIAAETTRHIGY